MAVKRPLSGRLKNQAAPETEPEGIEVSEDSLAAQLVGDKVTFNDMLQEFLASTGPWLAVAVVFHFIVIFIFAAIILSQPIKETETIKTIKLPFKDPKKLDMELPRDVIDNKKLPKETPSNQDPVWKNAEVSDHTETADDEDYHESKGDSYDFLSDKPLKGSGVYDMLGVGGGAGGAYGGPRGGRRDLVGTGGGGALTESAVLAGLMWLARHQNPDGSWGAKSFQNQCKGTTCDGGGHDENLDVGLTGAASLAFTGATYSPGSKDVYGGIRFGDVVRKAVLYLKDVQKDDGSFCDPVGKPMYNNAVATYALTDLIALMTDKGEKVGISIFKNATAKGVKYLVTAQNPGKAWRYTPKSGDNDASITGWCAMALKAAEEGGFEVPETVWTGIKSHLDDVTDPTYGNVGYTSMEGMSVLAKREEKLFNSGQLSHAPSLTAVGIMMRIFIGEKRSSAKIKNGTTLLMKNLPTWDTSLRGKIDYYYWFYGSYCLNQFDGPKGPCWTKWNEAMKDVLVKNQKTSQDGCANGSWDAIDRWSEEVGRVYSTAISILTMEVYYRLRILATGRH